jgi:hypothetical protein
MTPPTARSNGKSKKERLAQEIAKAVGAGRPVSVETVDFNDPNRPKTCLEVDFPILPINRISQIEGNAGKPIYQLSKWWARRRSSVFRAMLLAAAIKAPEDAAQAAKAVWDVYYANHQKKGALKHLKVADIFMGGGTTIVEGSRLGMEMYGCDLNPVAWFVVKNEMARVNPAAVQSLLDEIEVEVKPQIMPFYACDCPRGHKGTWTRLSTGDVMQAGFDPLALTQDERKDFRYEGPEIIYVFWAKHGPCQATGCGHRTPIMSSPIVAVKILTVKAWEDFQCDACGEVFDVEASESRMAPGVPLVVAPAEKKYTIRQHDASFTCPQCGHKFPGWKLDSKGANKKVPLTLILHPSWLAGQPSTSPDGQLLGGSPGDTADATAAWYTASISMLRFIEIRGSLPDSIRCPYDDVEISIRTGTVPKRSHFACGSCGRPQDLLASTKLQSKTAPTSPIMLQGFCPRCSGSDHPYGGRFFAPITNAAQFNSAEFEWEARRDKDLNGYWPLSAIPYGLEADFWSVRYHGYTHWWKMFNSRQLLVHAQILRAIQRQGDVLDGTCVEITLAAFQQYLRNQCMFTLWNMEADKLEPQFSKNNMRPKVMTVENNVYGRFGRGNWLSCSAAINETLAWSCNPWELAIPSPSDGAGPKSFQVETFDPITSNFVLDCRSSTDLDLLPESIDVVITDPPFGDQVQYAELSDFFYSWLRLALQASLPNEFGREETPKLVEAVTNKARNPQNPTENYKNILTECFVRANRVLKAGGILAFTFHHNEDEHWALVLESLFEAGFCLEQTYPIRGDETKGEGEFGAQKVEYDIIHVCRKRTADPTPVSWAKMRREVLRDVRQLADLLELHHKQGLPEGDLKVIKRGKALEYFSRHFGQVFVDEGKKFSVRDALIGINQLLDEESGTGKEPPPVNAEPFTRQFLRLFDGVTQQPRDQMQKLLRGTTIDPKEYEQSGWCKEAQKVYHLSSPLEIAQEWHGKHRRRLTSDYDQAMVLIGASFPSSGINVTDTLNNANFRPHAALGRLLRWHTTHGATRGVREAATLAVQLYGVWESQHQDVARQLKLFFDDGEEG